MTSTSTSLVVDVASYGQKWP